MFKKILSFVLVVLLLNIIGVSSVYAAGSKEEKEARFTERVRASISKLGIGTKAQVEVKLRNKAKLKGYVSQANTESFTITHANSVATEVEYPNVKQVKGNNQFPSKKYGPFIAVGIVVVAIILVATVFAGK